MKNEPKNIGAYPPLFKIDLKLKLTTLLFLVAIFNMKAHTYAQGKVSLDMKNSTVEKVIEAIEQKTDYRFVYNINDIMLNRQLTVKVKEQPINKVLETIFRNTDVAYSLSGTQVILKKRVEELGAATFQQIIKGRILDENGLPLPGASVLEQGTTNAVSTDIDGNFEINVSSADAILIVKFIGYKDKSYPAAQFPAELKLEINSSELTEVVVIGYGTANKKDVTGAVSSIKAEEMNQGAISTPLQLIGGKMAGVNINQIGSEPGSTPSVRIRGVSSLIGGSDPLVVIDGIQGNLELLNQIAPTDIASIDVLKDASATAVYGSRGAPGVIIVTTKRSTPGTTTVEYNSNVSFDFIPKKLDMLTASEWWETAQEVGVPASANHGSDTDWYDIMTRMGYTQTHSLSFGGGTEKFNYRASVSAILQEGVVINSGNQKYIGNLQASQLAFDDKLKLTFNLNSGIHETQSMVQSIGNAAFTSNLISQAYIMRPTDPVFNTDGSYFTDPNVFQYLNPYAVSQTTKNNTEYENLFGSLMAELDLFEGMKATWFGSWRKTNNVIGFYIPVASTDANAINQGGFANVRNQKQNERLTNFSLNYKKRFGEHSFNILGLYEWQNQMYTGSFAQIRGFINDDTSFNALQLGDITSAVPGDISSYKNDRTLVSFMGRLNYTLMDRYLLTASLRRDGSSVFGVNNKWGNFPSASVGWQIDREPFMANQNIFSELKLRGGYGVTGNQQGLGPQSSLSLVGESGVTYFGGQQITNYSIIQNGNDDLKWETKKQTNIGLDFAMFNSRLKGTIDLYTATTDNLLFSYTVPQPPFPHPTIIANVGSLKNEGLEIALGYDLIQTDDLKLTLAGNATFMRNEVLNLSGSINGVPLITDNVPWGYESYLIEGQPIGTFNIMHHTGKDDQNVETVEDINGDGVIDFGNTSEDRRMQGQVLPKYTFAFNPSLRYKNFDFTMLWRGSGGNKIWNSLRKTLSQTENIGRSNILASGAARGIYTSQYASDLYLEDGSFVRLDNVTLGYNLKLDKLKYVDMVRFSVTGNNLLLITDYSGLDPELNFTGGSGGGGDNGIYPRVRSIAFGFNIKFK